TTCSAPFASGTAVTLTATSAAGSTFTGWSGGCIGTATTCTVTMSAAPSVTATFTLQTFPLTVTKAGAARGPLTRPPPPLPPPGAPRRHHRPAPFRAGPRRDVARHAGRGLDLHRLERRLHRHRQHLYRHRERGPLCHGQLRAVVVRAHRDQGRRRQRHRHQRA